MTRFTNRMRKTRRRWSSQRRWPVRTRGSPRPSSTRTRSTGPRSGTARSPSSNAGLKTWHERGYSVVDLEADTFGGDMRFAAAFQHNTDKRHWLIDSVMTAVAYDAKFEQAKKDGLRLVDREIYDRNGARYYGAV